MSQTAPTTKQIRDTLVANMSASLNQSIPLMPKAFIRVMATALAGVVTLLYKFGGFWALQMFVSSATLDYVSVNGTLVSPLREWGALVGIPEPDPGTNAQLLIDIPVQNIGGDPIPSATQLIGRANGVTYITLGSTVLDAAVVQVEVKAVQDQQDGAGVGAIGNLDPGSILDFATTPADVDSETTVNAQTVQGTDAESAEEYRNEIEFRFASPPQGGAYVDYALWALEVVGIINAYVYTGADGEVDVYTEATPESSGSADGIPTPAQLQAVLDSIELDQAGKATRRPVNAFVNSLGITRTGFDVQVTGITGVTDLGAVQQSIDAAMAEYFAEAEPYIEGLTIPPRRERLTQSSIIGIIGDIVSAAGGTFTDATFTLTGVPGVIAFYDLGAGEKSKIVNVTYS